jgi:DNA mismatch repair protein MutS2
MDTKTLSVLEYAKVLQRLTAHCDFSASKELALALQPTDSLDLARAWQAETTEAHLLIDTTDVTIGGAHDIRPQVELARRGGVLEPVNFLDIKSTLISSRELKKLLEKRVADCPRLAEIALALATPQGLVDAISRTVSDKGEVLDSASPKLASLRSQVRVAHERLMSRLQKYVTDGQSASMLQESIITQRDGRYVIPLRAEFKGRIKAIVHDQSASGATLFVEPLAVVELNNSYRELQLAERDEERRVLAELSAQVALHAEPLTTGVQAIAELDLAFAKAKYAIEIHASEPVLHPLDDGRQTTAHHPSSIVCRLIHARHPLLDPNTVVPIDVDLKPGTFAMVITGPNTGGKTVTLKTVGLMVLMAQSGLHIPAQSGSELACFKAVWADIGDEQSIEQSLSTFSGHITNIIKILKKADARALVILDELGAGTDPQEGAALARAILTHLLSANITTLVATHYPELKTFAHSTPGVVNASLEFDIQTLRPTYKLTIGLPGRSNALAIASRLGLPEAIVSAARGEISPDNLRADKLLDDIRKERNRTSREREKIEKSRQKNEALNRDLEKRLEAIEDERREVIAKARAEAELEIEVLKRNIESLKAQLRKARQPLDAIKEIEERVETVAEKIQAPVERKKSKIQRSTLNAQPRLGERVTVSTLNAEGVITALGESDAEVQIGSLRIRARLSDLQRKTEQSTTDDTPQTIVHRPSAVVGTQSPGLELDLRGKMAEEALEMLDRYLEQAYMAGLLFVRIIHGKGTGKLRQAVREALRGHPHVTSFEEGGPKEGGEGVTVAKMR